MTRLKATTRQILKVAKAGKSFARKHRSNYSQYRRLQASAFKSLKAKGKIRDFYHV